jgi:hypothetical protein
VGRCVALLLGAAMLCACPTTTTPCGAGSCEGCCDSDGRCLVGNAHAACGASGGKCTACTPAQSCLGGACAVPTPCSKPEDCSLTKCICGDGVQESSRTCAMGVCGADCDGACTAAGHPKPGDTPDGGPDFSMCVAGTASSCTGTDLVWEGMRCCVVTGYSQCVDGTAAGCKGANLAWTGSTCCVKSGFGPCSAGTAEVCSGDNFAWTGSTCCVSDAYVLCGDGLPASCATDGLLWTGSKCCALAEYTQCVDGTAQGCTGTNVRWTGSLCCVKNRTTCVDGTQPACTGDWTGKQCCT